MCLGQLKSFSTHVKSYIHIFVYLFHDELSMSEKSILRELCAANGLWRYRSLQRMSCDNHMIHTCTRESEGVKDGREHLQYLNLVEEVLVHTVWILFTELYHNLRSHDSHMTSSPQCNEAHLAQVDFLMYCGHYGSVRLGRFHQEILRIR